MLYHAQKAFNVIYKFWLNGCPLFHANTLVAIKSGYKGRYVILTDPQTAQ